MDSNNKKCPHGFYLGPNGEHIIPNNTAVSIEEAAKVHTWGGTVFSQRPKTETKQKSTEELVEEVKKVLGKKEPDVTTVQPPETKQYTVKELSRLLEGRSR